MAELELDARLVSSGIFIRAVAEDELQIICNWCNAIEIFYEGNHFKPSYTGNTWLADAVTHLLEHHETELKRRA